MRNWDLKGLLKPKGTGSAEGWESRPHRLYRLGDIIALVRQRGGMKTNPCPIGYVWSDVAGERMGLDGRKVTLLARRGELEHYRVPMGPSRYSYAISERSIIRWLNARGVVNSGEEFIMPADDVMPPLICARDETCLQARRELWQLKGRKWGRKFWKVLEGRRRAG